MARENVAFSAFWPSIELHGFWQINLCDYHVLRSVIWVAWPSITLTPRDNHLNDSPSFASSLLHEFAHVSQDKNIASCLTSTLAHPHSKRYGGKTCHSIIPTNNSHIRSVRAFGFPHSQRGKNAEKKRGPLEFILPCRERSLKLAETCSKNDFSIFTEDFELRRFHKARLTSPSTPHIEMSPHMSAFAVLHSPCKLLSLAVSCIATLKVVA